MQRTFHSLPTGDASSIVRQQAPNAADVRLPLRIRSCPGTLLRLRRLRAANSLWAPNAVLMARTSSAGRLSQVHADNWGAQTAFDALLTQTPTAVDRPGRQLALAPRPLPRTPTAARMPRMSAVRFATRSSFDGCKLQAHTGVLLAVMPAGTRLPLAPAGACRTPTVSDARRTQTPHDAAASATPHATYVPELPVAIETLRRQRPPAPTTVAVTCASGMHHRTHVPHVASEATTFFQDAPGRPWSGGAAGHLEQS